ncbi:MAG: hypothetical protein WCF84_20850 [Anaerolineae bacterium]
MMRRALLVAFLVVVLSLGIVAIAGAATIQGASPSAGLSLQPAADSAAAWVSGFAPAAPVDYAPVHDGYHCDHAGDSAVDSTAGY